MISRRRSFFVLICVCVFVGEETLSPDIGSAGEPAAHGVALRPTSDDRDGDGIADIDEDRIARQYLPFLSLSPDDRCPLVGLLYRLRPHPHSPRRLHMVVIALFERDCGVSSHLGDNEVFGMTIDPQRAAPHGILALRAIAHDNTFCEHVSTCGNCTGLTPCATAFRNGKAYPVVYYSKNKHGAYLSSHECNGACFFTNWCQLNDEPARPPMLNAGEPHAPMAEDLTRAGLISRSQGWSADRLFHFNPWSETDFGEAGNVTQDLVDDTALTPACLP